MLCFLLKMGSLHIPQNGVKVAYCAWKNAMHCWWNQRISHYFTTSISVPVHRAKRKSRCFVNKSDVFSCLKIRPVPCLKDNYAYIVHDEGNRKVGIVDPSEAAPVIDVLDQENLNLMYIFNTHHHYDHTGGNLELKVRYGAKVIGFMKDKDRIPGIDILLHDGEKWMFGRHEMVVIETPGHTRGHVSYYFPASGILFTGDTLFSLSCGKLFEGSPEEMLSSLNKLITLPDDTRVYFGHEYTLSNTKFALSVEPKNESLKAYSAEVAHLRSQGLPTVPTTLHREKLCNPFLRTSSAEIREILDVALAANDAEVLATIRTAKDNWSGKAFAR